jgi:Tol biopolymer transport system component
VGAETSSLLAIDPETGNWSTVLDDPGTRPRVSPDGRMVAYVRQGAVWVGGLGDGPEAKRILDLEGTTAGSPLVWSPDGRQIITSLGTHDGNGPWAFRTVRIGADGAGRTDLAIPQQDGVHDWSSDGTWLLTTSSRNAAIGWQLYVMHLDGTGVRQITEGGNPFYARFSPDGRRVLYADGTTEERRGIWVVGADGADRRKVFATGKAIASPCWSPDGSRIAVTVRELGEERGCRVELMDLDGGSRRTVAMPDNSMGDMPDWR